jgi:hypothetical protein
VSEHKEEKTQLLSEKSGVTLSLMAVIIGGVLWMSNIASLAQTTSSGLNELKGFIYNELRAIRQELKEIRDRLPRDRAN